MQNALIATGHGYENHSEQGRCAAFDGYEILAYPLPGYSDAERDARVYGRGGSGFSVTYDSYTIRLAKREFSSDLFLLVQHGGGREVWRLHSVHKAGRVLDNLLALPEREQFATLLMLYFSMSDARAQAVEETRRKYASAFVDGRLKKRRRNGRYTVSIVDANNPNQIEY